MSNPLLLDTLQIKAIDLTLDRESILSNIKDIRLLAKAKRRTKESSSCKQSADRSSEHTGDCRKQPRLWSLSVLYQSPTEALHLKSAT